MADLLHKLIAEQGFFIPRGPRRTDWAPEEVWCESCRSPKAEYVACDRPAERPVRCFWCGELVWTGPLTAPAIDREYMDLLYCDAKPDPDVAKLVGILVRSIDNLDDPRLATLGDWLKVVTPVEALHG